MMVILYLASYAALALIVWQDLKYRAVSWILFPLSFLLLWFSMSSLDLKTFLESTAFNLAFLLLQIILLMIFFLFKGITWKNLLSDYIGTGDLLFFLLLALVLPFPVFPIFFVCSLMLSLILGLIIFRNSTVPLAGLQALFLMILIPLQDFGLLNYQT